MMLVLALTASFRVSSSHSAQQSQRAAAAKPADVDGARIIQADHEPENWLSHGRTYNEQRFSPLKAINDKNVNQVALAWYYSLDTRRGQEATPLVVDGVMYFTTAWSKVISLDAASGVRRWEYDPKVPPEWAVNACCDVVNRGVAAWKGKVFVGTLDGRLIALDAATGKPVWETLTIDPKMRYAITGAPRVVKGKVIIGNGGAEMGVRGYVSAYDAETGNLVWRFYTVPGDPSKPFESPFLEKAAKTWSGEWWKNGGGGTVWDAMAYDPQLDLLYIGSGNADPWARRIRNARAQDNLLASSIIALRPDTGEYVWDYQENSGDESYYDSAGQIILADLGSIKGHLTAWDPVKQIEVWRADRPGPLNGGVLSTAGNLVFEGTGNGQFEAFHANTGEKIWSASTQSGITAGPISYTVNGEQYIAILVGWGGVLPLAAGEVARQSPRMNNVPRMLAFKLGGKASLPSAPEVKPQVLTPPRATASLATVKKGEELYQRYCGGCHGDVAVSGGVLPDLRYSGALANQHWLRIVRDGVLGLYGMVGFSKELSRQDAEAIRAYVIFRANQSLAENPETHK